MFEPVPDDLASALAAHAGALGPFARLRYLAETGSTNDVAAALAEAGAPEGTSVLADRQVSGRGRLGRTWFSPPGAGVYLSVVVSHGGSAPELPVIALAAGVAVAGGIRAATGLPAELKWPNDAVIGRPWRKLAGLLCESSGSGGRPETVIVGIGINLRPAAYPPELEDRATSVEGELGRAVDRAPLVVACLGGLRDGLRMLREEGSGAVCEAWRRFGGAGLAGADVRWRERGVERTGVTRGLDPDGALVVETAGGRERIVAGEVTWERVPS